jgi:hypothetical protein
MDRRCRLPCGFADPVNPHRQGRNPAGEASSPTIPLRKVHACGMRTRPPQARSGLSGQPGTYTTKISCAAVRQRDPAASCAHEGIRARTRGRAVTGGGLHGRDVTDDVFCEWLLSDYPDARAERDWRRTAHLPGGDRPSGSRSRLGRLDQRPARRAAHVAGPGRLHSTAGRPDHGPRRSPLCRTRRGLLRPATPPSRDQRASLRPARLLGLLLPCPPDRAWRRRLPAATRTGRPRPARSGPHAEPQARSVGAGRRP